MDEYWRNDESFLKLCDMVAKGKFFCLTGSGISKNWIMWKMKNSLIGINCCSEYIKASWKTRIDYPEKIRKKLILY